MAVTALTPALAATGRSLFGTTAELRPASRSSDWVAVKMLASSAARRGQLTKAGRLLWGVLGADPRNRQIRQALALVMIQRDRPLEALALLDELLSETPGDFQSAERRGFVLVRLGRLEAALQQYTHLLADHPDDQGLLVARGQIMLAMGQEDEAIADYRRAISINPRFGEAWWALANVKTVRLTKDDIAMVQSLIRARQLSQKSQIDMEFALGKALEDARNFDRSFGHYRAGNELQAVNAFRNRDATRHHVDQTIQFFTENVLANHLSEASEGPIFIIGMPRSGSTLVEQILASHPNVEGTAELPTLPVLARSLGEFFDRSHLEYVDLLAGLPSEAFKQLGDRYLEQTSAYRRTDQPFFIDKMPSNWLHVGLIRLIVPNAKIVDVRRDPLDCCFSNYAQNYPRGHEFTHKLADLGDHYRDYVRLMAHFDAIAPGWITRVIYEDLVGDPEETIRLLLHRLGLAFDEACLRFFENDRPVQTPSAQQVRQPMNRRGIGRSRPYEPWLGPLVKALAGRR